MVWPKFLVLGVSDLAVLHVYPQVTSGKIAAFLEETNVAMCRPGLSLDLHIEPEVAEVYLVKLDTIFVMSTPIATYGLQPGSSTDSRLTEVKKLIAKYNPRCRIGLDGGVNTITFPRFIAKIDELVIGSLLFHASDINAQWKALQTYAKGLHL